MKKQCLGSACIYSVLLGEFVVFSWLTHRWNLGNVDTILDNQTKLCQKAGILEEPKEEKIDESAKFKCMYCAS